MKTLGIDPGEKESAYLVLENGKPIAFEIAENANVRTMLMLCSPESFDSIGIEMVASYGMPVGKETFETVLWIGRFAERCPIEPTLVYRKDIKMHFCQSMRAKDGNVRQALIDCFGGKEAAIGKKASPGPLHGIASHVWSALAIAIFVQDARLNR